LEFMNMEWDRCLVLGCRGEAGGLLERWEGGRRVLSLGSVGIVEGVPMTWRKHRVWFRV
jgi:hypothetical protein